MPKKIVVNLWLPFLVGLHLFCIPRAFPRQMILKADLDPLITLPGAYALTPDDLPKLFKKGNWNKNPYFKYLQKDKSRAIFQKKDLPELKVGLSLMEGTVPVDEVVVDFKDGKFLGVTISIFNRGDEGKIEASDFDRRFKTVGKRLGKELACRPTKREAMPSKGVLTTGYIWISARGKAVLEYNPEAPEKVEFLRMRMARRDAGGAYEAATKSRAIADVRLSVLPGNVKRNAATGDVFVAHIPMVDQGAKGYCVVASVQRLFEYYGIACDMHQLAQLAGSDPDRGTNPLTINRELGAIDHFFKTRFSCLAVGYNGGLVELVGERGIGKAVTEKDFYKLIHKNIDEGIPLLWGLNLGKYEEQPPISPQLVGGHMRMIIGYNEKTDRIIFSDSWGAGHEFKTMDAHDSFLATEGLFLLKPTTR